MSSEDVRRRMGQYAELLSHRFDLPEIIRQWHELLSGIAAGPRKKMTQPMMN